MPRVVLGGGLSGLSALHYLQKKFPNVRPTLIEGSNRVGGWIKSKKLENGVLIEQSARTIRPRGDAGVNTLNLIEDLGLEKNVVPVSMNSAAAKNRMVYAKSELHSLPNSLMSIFKHQEPFSGPLIKFLLMDLRNKSIDVPDEPIYNFVNRRFGPEVADYLISPMICGICAGDAKTISVKFLMKTLFEYEQKYGSITRGLAFNMLSSSNNLEGGVLANRAKVGKWSVYYFKDGLETLPIALENKIRSNNGALQLNTKCKNIEFYSGQVHIFLDNGTTVDTKNLISAISAQTLAPLVEAQHPKLAELLQRIQCVTVGVVNLHFDQKLIKNPGFGFLVSPKENLPILGCIYDSCLNESINGTTLTVMMGGHWFNEQFGKEPSKDYLLETALRELNKILKIKDKPSFHQVSILKNCIPQYVVGHEETVKNIETYIKDNDLNLGLCGASYYGVGVNDVVYGAKKIVDKLN